MRNWSQGLAVGAGIHFGSNLREFASFLEGAPFGSQFVEEPVNLANVVQEGHGVAAGDPFDGDGLTFQESADCRETLVFAGEHCQGGPVSDAQ